MPWFIDPPTTVVPRPGWWVYKHVTSVGIPSAEAFGIPMISVQTVNLSPVGISSSEVFGVPVVSVGVVNIAPVGIPSVEAFGALVVSMHVAATGVPSAEAFGVPVVASGAVDIAPTGIASAEAFGMPIVTQQGLLQIIASIGIASEEAFGTPTVSVGAVNISPSGIASAEVFGTVVITPGAVNVAPAGIASSEAFGMATISRGAVDLSPTGIPSAEAFGTPTVSVGTVNVSPTGIASVEAVGTPVISVGAVNIAPVGIASAEAFGTPAVNHVVYVTRDTDSGNLMLSGQRFRWAGPNVQTFGLSETTSAYGATTDAQGLHLPNHAEIDATMSAITGMNATVVRAMQAVMNVGKTNSVQPTLGNFNAAALEPVDYALQQCALAGIKVVLPLVDNYQYYTNGKFWYCTQNDVTPNAQADEFFSNTTVINSFKAHISFVLDHVNQYTGVAYKDDSTILAWETGNELYGTTTWDSGTVNGPAWTDSISQYIKVTKGAKQLVVDGHSGISAADTTSLDLAYVDIYTDHTYNNNGDPQWVVDTGLACHNKGKAWWLGEYTWTGAGFAPQPTWTLEQMLDVIEDSIYVDGDNFWALWPQLESWGDGFALHWPGDNDNMRNRARMLADHAERMSVITPRQFVNDGFTGTNGVLLETLSGWNKQVGSGDATIQNGRANAGLTEAHYYRSEIPASSDYSVKIDVYTASLLNTSLAGVMARMQTDANTGYSTFVYYNGSTTVVYLKRWLAGVGVDLGNFTVTNPTVASSHSLELKVEGDSLWVYWDNTRVIGPITDVNIPFAGRAGILAYNSSSTTGFHLDNIIATDPLPGVQVPAPSLILPNHRFSRLNYGALVQY